MEFVLTVCLVMNGPVSVSAGSGLVLVLVLVLVLKEHEEVR